MNKNIYSKDEYLNLDVKKDEVVNIYHFIYNSSCQVNINMIVNVTDGVSKIRPKLLIENYDTSSAHSAYIGGFKDEALFYLASRGISYEVAFEMLIQGFLLNEANKDEKIVQNLLSKVGDVKWIK